MDSHALTSTLLTTVLLSFSALGLAASTSQSELETEFKAAYEKFRQAVIAKDHAQMKQAMSASAYMIMKNQGVAFKMDFPKGFFEGMPGKLHAALDLSKLRILQAFQKNNTGTLIVLATRSARFNPFGMDSDPEPALLVLSFIKEAGVWKYDTLSIEGIDDSQESTLLKGDFTKLKEDAFQPSGVVPPVPAEEAAPDYDYDAVLNIVFGHDVEVTLNGKIFEKANGSRASRTGVKKGENTIVIKCAGSSSLKISIQARKDGGTEPVRVFDLDVENPEPVITKTFVVNLE
jgi:hypothetical protein